MDSSLSRIEAEIFINHFKNEQNIKNYLNKYKHYVIFYNRYVDDILCLFKLFTQTNKNIQRFPQQRPHIFNMHT